MAGEGFTKKNLKDDIDDIAGANGVEGLAAHFAAGELDLQESGLSYQRVEPGKRQPWGHRHKKQEEIYVILSGSGMSLAIDGREPVLLTQQSEPFAFPADIRAVARLKAGPITDLNVMTRRGTFAHEVERLYVRRNWTGTTPAAISLLLCHQGDVVFELNGESGALDNGDALMIEARAGATLTLIGTAICYRVAITAT